MVLGVISPNISNIIVTIRVAIPMPELPKKVSAIEVTTADSEILTILLPMRSVFNKRFFLSRSFPALTARLSFLLRKKRSRSLLIDKKAVSDAEKIMERMMRTAQRMSNPHSES